MSGWDGWKPFEQKNKPIIIWLVVLTILKNISLWEGLSNILWKNMKNKKMFQTTNQITIVVCFFSVRLIEQQWVFETPQPDQNDPFLGANSSTICVPLMFHDFSTGCTQQKTCKDKATSRALQLCSKVSMKSNNHGLWGMRNISGSGWNTHGAENEAEKRYFCGYFWVPLLQLFLPATESYNFSMVSLMSSMQYLSLNAQLCCALPYPPSQPFPTDLAELSYCNQANIINDPETWKI